MTKKKKTNVLLPIAVVLFITAVAMVLMIFGRNSYTNIINKGVSINNIDVSNMTTATAKSVINQQFNSQFKNKKIKMIYENKTFSIDYKSLKAHYDVNSAVEQAFKYAKNDGILENILKNTGIHKSRYSVELKFLADTSIVDHAVKRIARKIDYKPVDSTMKLVGTTFNITNDVTGRRVDQEKLISMIKASVTPNKDDEVINIPVEVVDAHIKMDMLSKVNTVISSFTTHFNTGDASRSSNIRIAATAVDGSVVMPGEIFSMNKAVGPRIAAKGYQEAHVIINGQLTTGLAGGICQATTTVYNAALLANFDIVERRGHGLRVGYVKPGLDATISGDYIDLKFKNTNKYPIYIHTIIKNGTVTADIYGANEHPGLTVQLDSTVLEKIDPPKPEYVYDPTLKEGSHVVDSKSIEGMKSISYRKVFLSGKLIKTEVLSKDKYKAARAIIRVGTKRS